MKKKVFKPVAAATIPLDSDLIDETQACALLGVLPRTLRLWRNTRSLPHLKITSKIIRYRRSDINAWLDRSRTVIAA